MPSKLPTSMVSAFNIFRECLEEVRVFPEEPVLQLRCGLVATPLGLQLCHKGTQLTNTL